jgi:hypothetical protein
MMAGDTPGGNYTQAALEGCASDLARPLLRGMVQS